ARTAADSVLQTARETADAKRGARNLQLVKEERTRADVLVVTERAAADDCLREERQQRKSALATLLRLEREDTDTHLLTERGHAAGSAGGGTRRATGRRGARLGRRRWNRSPGG